MTSAGPDSDRSTRSAPTPSIGEALERVSHAGHRLASSQLDLLLHEFRRHLILLAVGAIVGAFAILGWTYVVAGAVNALSELYPRSGVQAVVGLLHLAGAAAILVANRRRFGL